MTPSPNANLSRPIGARGLKPSTDSDPENGFDVAPHRGAWVETTRSASAFEKNSVAPHRGAWVETSLGLNSQNFYHTSRPIGARGLKQQADQQRADAGQSRPIGARGLKHAAVERALGAARGVAPHRGAWVETLYLGRRGIGSRSRPIGARGLKRETTGSRLRSAAVAPHRGAWVETLQWGHYTPPRSSRPLRGAWVEMPPR